MSEKHAPIVTVQQVHDELVAILRSAEDPKDKLKCIELMLKHTLPEILTEPSATAAPAGLRALAEEQDSRDRARGTA